MDEANNQELSAPEDKLAPNTLAKVTERAKIYAIDEQGSCPHKVFREFTTSLLGNSTEFDVNVGLIQKDRLEDIAIAD